MSSKHPALRFRVPVRVDGDVTGVFTGTIKGGPEVERWFAEHPKEIARMISDATRSFAHPQ